MTLDDLFPSDMQAQLEADNARYARISRLIGERLAVGAIDDIDEAARDIVARAGAATHLLSFGATRAVLRAELSHQTRNA